MRGDTDGTVNIALTADWYVYIYFSSFANNIHSLIYFFS
jgi:hypothetical protein